MREWLVFRPRAQDQLARFVEALAQFDRWIAVGEHRIHWRAEYETGDHAAAGNAVEIRHLLGDALRRVIEGE